MARLSTTILIACALIIGCEGERGPVGPPGPSGGTDRYVWFSPAPIEGNEVIYTFQQIDFPTADIPVIEVWISADRLYYTQIPGAPPVQNYPGWFITHNSLTLMNCDGFYVLIVMVA